MARVPHLYCEDMNVFSLSADWGLTHQEELNFSYVEIKNSTTSFLTFIWMPPGFSSQTGMRVKVSVRY